MNFHPQQITALEYLRRKGTEAAVPQLYGHVAKTFQDFEAYLHTVPVALRGAKPSPQAWSAHEVIDHLVESHRPAVEQLRSLAAGKRPETAPIPASLQSENPFQRSWEDLVAELRGIHRSYLALIEGASEATDVKTPVVMVIKIDNAPVTWEAELDWKAYAQAFRVHTVEHKAQIERTLAALAAPAPESGLPDVPAWPWSDELDSVRAAPRFHLVLCETEDIRLLHVIVEPGQKEPFHTHRWPSVLVVTRPARLRYYGADGALSAEVEPDPADGLKGEEMAPEGLHAVENIDAHPYEAFRMEMKKGGT